MKYWKKYGILFGSILLLGSVSFLLPWKEEAPRVPALARIGDQSFTLEIADTDAERAKGLGYRDSLCASCGMLFLFNQPDRYSFWMKGMRFPLDIIWLRGTEVVFIARSVDPGSLAIISPPGPADRVLEVNAGKAASLKEGDHLEFR